GPPFVDHGPLCLIHDTATGRWGATARLPYRGIGLTSPGECTGLAAGLGELLRGLTELGILDRVSLLVRTVPDEGTAYRLWRRDHELPGMPGLVRDSAQQAAAAVTTASVSQEAF